MKRKPAKLMAVAALLAMAWGLQALRDHSNPLLPERAAIIDAAIGLAQQHALNRGKPDWAQTRRAALAIAERSGREADLDAALQAIVAALDDRHSFYLPRPVVQGLHGPAQAGGAEALAMLLPAVNGVPHLLMRGYLAIEPARTRRAAGALRTLLARAQQQSDCGLIVDLSANDGGNMWPMALGLLPLLSEGRLGAFENVEGERSDIVAADGVLSYAGQVPIEALPPPFAHRYRQGRIAVLIGPGTGSSGELVALLFRGQANTRFFGAPTSGINTGNQMFPLPHGGMLALTVSHSLDRDGRRQVGPIQPDEPRAPAETDEALEQRAARWVLAGCGASAMAAEEATPRAAPAFASARSR